jgi:hypothetical protein
MGSTNYGKLTNVSIVPEASADAIIASAGTGDETYGEQSGGGFPQSWEFVATAINNNVILISGGALGFPVL